MLIASPRHTRADLEAWARWEAMDRAFVGAARAKLDEMEARAMSEVHAFADAGACYIGTSWGKDSVVTLHLALRAYPTLPIAWVRAATGDNPDSVLVRDAFFATWPDRSGYHEAIIERAETDDVRDVHQAGWRVLATRLGTARHISGVRAEESSTRRMSIGARGLSTRNSCRPIGHWQAEHVFAYLHRYDLPVHPAYACSMGGTLDRRNLRVAALGGERGTRFGRAEWERRYYGEGKRAP